MRVLVFSVLNVSELIRRLTCVRNLEKLQETMHVHVRLLSKDSTFDLFNFFTIFFSKIWVAKLGVRLICECGLYASVYNNRKYLIIQFEQWELTRWNSLMATFLEKLSGTWILSWYWVYVVLWFTLWWRGSRISFHMGRRISYQNNALLTLPNQFYTKNKLGM